SRLPSLVERGRGRGKMSSDTTAGIRLPLPLWRGGRGCVIFRRGCIPHGMQGRVWGYLSTERR
ncbi:MAG: hypothetical protein LBD27_06070, partial [Tannerella sp.]|nr:hypothetical protein [Tannerella sp.]